MTGASYPSRAPASATAAAAPATEPRSALALEQRAVGVDHEADQLLEARPRLPAEHPLGLLAVADQVVDLGGSLERLVHHDVIVDPHPGLVEGDVHALTNRVGLAGGDHEVLGVVLLEHEPHGLDVVLGIAPVALGVEVAERQL